jgi:hypothetical protein
MRKLAVKKTNPNLGKTTIDESIHPSILQGICNFWMDGLAE